MHFELKTFLQGLLITDDHVSMAHGLETRVPFLDNELADLAFRLPPSMKVNTARLACNSQGPCDSADGKRILRRAMSATCPRSSRSSRSRAFRRPTRTGTAAPRWTTSARSCWTSRTTGRPWFDQQFVQARLEEHFAGKRNHRLLIWSLLSFELLQRHFVDQPAGPPANVGHLSARGMLAAAQVRGRAFSTCRARWHRAPRALTEVLACRC